MTVRTRGLPAILVLIFLMGILGPISNVSSQEASCCTDDSFELFLIGDADSGGLTPFESEIDETESKLVNQVLQPVEVGSWKVPWGIDGDYPADTWDFNIHYEFKVLLASISI